MSIEDVQLINDNDLADKLAELMGWKLEEHPEVNGRGQWMAEYEFGVFYKQDGTYQERLCWEPSDDWGQAHEVQAKAIERKPREYIDNLIRIVLGDLPIYKIYENYLLELHYLTVLLQATPRQIAEATYLTLKG